MTNELKSCPFCGEEASLWIDMPYEGDEEYRIQCDLCKAQSISTTEKSEAIETWNKRVEQPNTK